MPFDVTKCAHADKKTVVGQMCHSLHPDDSRVHHIRILRSNIALTAQRIFV